MNQRSDRRTYHILSTTSSMATDDSVLRAAFDPRGLCLIQNPLKRKLQPDETAALLAEYEPVGLLAGTENLSRSVLDPAQKYLKVISRIGVGWDNVDREAAAEFGILTYRTPGVLDQAVAELTMAMILSALRGLAASDRMIRQNHWQKTMGRLLAGKTVGIIGLGSIGRRVSQLVNAFGARVIYHDTAPMGVDGAEPVTMERLLAQADIISIHTSGGGTVMGEREFNAIGKKNVLLVNTARGTAVDEKVLCRKLSDGTIGFACLDVFSEEPYHGPLRSFENVLLTPHIGSYAMEARLEMEQVAIENLIIGLNEAGIL